MTDRTGDSVTAQRERLLDKLRLFGGYFTEFSRVFARSLELHATDAVALLQIIAAEEHGVPLSPARLSEDLPLSSGATTALLNRLEEAGHVVRSREHDDRRIVTLRSSDNVHRQADAFFRPLGERLDLLLAGYQPELLSRFEAFIDEMSLAMDIELDAHGRGQ